MLSKATQARWSESEPVAPELVSGEDPTSICIYPLVYLKTYRTLNSGIQTGIVLRQMVTSVQMVNCYSVWTLLIWLAGTRHEFK